MKWKIDPTRKSILDDDHRYKVLCCGRRWGKSYFSFMWLLSDEIKANERRWIIYPTYRQAKMVAWGLLKSIFKERQVKINESELSVILENGGRIELKGADKEDSLRGVSLGSKGGNAVVLDEYAYMKPNVWSEIVQPMLAETQGKCLFVGTPNGIQNHFYDLYVRGQSDDSDYRSWSFTTLEGGFIPEEEIESAKKNLDERSFKQEYLGSFEVSSNVCAYNFDRDHHVKELEISSRQFWGVDFGVASYMTAVLMCEYTNGDVYVFDEIGLQNSNTFELADQMKNICKGLPVFPDPAGKARTSNSTRSDHRILQDAGFTIISRKSNPTQKDRLNALNKKLQDANGKRTLFIHPKCKNLIRDLEMTTLDKGRILKTETLSHHLDALCYPIEYRYPLMNNFVESIKW